MIQGKIVNMQAIIGVTFRLPGYPDFDLEFVMDTGFAGALTLPPDVIAALNLPLRDQMRVNLADDSPLYVNVHTATIVWDGTKYEAAIQAMGKRPLLGMALLAGYHIDADFAEGKPFILTKLCPNFRSSHRAKSPRRMASLRRRGLTIGRRSKSGYSGIQVFRKMLSLLAICTKLQ